MGGRRRKRDLKSSRHSARKRHKLGAFRQFIDKMKLSEKLEIPKMHGCTFSSCLADKIMKISSANFSRFGLFNWPVNGLINNDCHAPS